KGILPAPLRKKATQRTQELLTIDIKEISIVGIHHHLRKGESEASVTSLYEIDCMIEEKEALEEDEETTEEIEKKLPAAFSKYANVCLKAASDTLPPHHVYDHKIELEEKNNLSYNQLYLQSVEEVKSI